MRMCVLLLLVFSPSILANDSAKEAKKTELKKLQGTWRLTGLVRNATVMDIPEDYDRKFAIEDNKLIVLDVEARTRYEWFSLAIDPSTSPKLVDLTGTKSKKTLEGIYSLEGNTFKLCFSKVIDGVKERPSDFSAKDHSQWMLMVFEREKD